MDTRAKLFAYALAAFWCVGLPAIAQEQILIPIVIETEVAGANGSRWITELIGRNDGNTSVQVTQGPERCMITCPHMPGAAQTTFPISPTPAFPGGGVFLFVHGNVDSRVSFNLRVQDVSRQAQTWGTELPVVRTEDGRTDGIRLINVPIDSRFRVALRIYDLDSRPKQGTAVRLRVFRIFQDALAVDDVINLSTTTLLDPAVPSQAQIADLSARYPQLAGSDRVRVEITASDGSRIWAFVSVTNNETQHVTTISPQ